MASLGVKFTWAGEPGDMLVKTVLGWVALGGYLCGLRTESKGETVSLLILMFLIFRFPIPSEPALSGSLVEVDIQPGSQFP